MFGIASAQDGKIRVISRKGRGLIQMNSYMTCPPAILPVIDVCYIFYAVSLPSGGYECYNDAENIAD